MDADNMEKCAQFCLDRRRCNAFTFYEKGTYYNTSHRCKLMTIDSTTPRDMEQDTTSDKEVVSGFHVNLSKGLNAWSPRFKYPSSSGFPNQRPPFVL